MDDSREDLEHRAFPVLDEDQIEALRRFGDERATEAGDVLFQAGDAIYPLVVVLEGRTQILDCSEGGEVVIEDGGRGEIHGELAMLIGQRAFADCVVGEPGRVLLVPPDRLREAIRTSPELSDLLVGAFVARRQVLMGLSAASLTLVGNERSAPAVALKEFLDRSRIPHRFLDRGDPEAASVLGPFGPSPPEGTLAVVRGTRLLVDPRPLDLARALGLDLVVDQTEPADLLVIGTGPAGLATAVFAASEGLSTVAVDDVAIGGQAGTSSRIENYPGFPSGISGAELAFRTAVQAIKFGARVTVPRRAVGLARRKGCFSVRLDEGGELRGHALVVATGARYRRLGLAGEERFERTGIFYAATDVEARFCGGSEVVVIGGGNSAGQAAMFLSRHARRVHLAHRGDELRSSMSEYLVARLERTENVALRHQTRVTGLLGEDRLDGVVLAEEDGATERLRTPALFVMIGAEPRTGWLGDCLELDRDGFVLTGPAAGAASPFETSLAGVFAVGDVRSGSVKRVASAVGEGSVAVQAVHAYLAADHGR